MIVLYSIEDRILLKPEDLNIEGKLYEDIVLSKIREKYVGKVIYNLTKVLFNHGIGVTIKKLIIKKNLIVETEGLINIEVNNTFI
jgi:DNA-directed RNA polymerase subunit E'/Rpb7